MSQSAPVIVVKDLVKKFGETAAVDGLSLSIAGGRLFGFLGPNGAGKSTTIGCITGILDPTSGSVELLGERFTANSIDLKRRIGVMPEGLALFDQLYAHEFLAFQARMFGVDEPTMQARVTELLEVFDLANTRRQRLAQFSTGMRKKVAFAAAVIHNPEILFLDEPFESLDPATVAMIKQWLQRFVAQGRTVFMTSHVLETVERLCDEVAIIKAGKLAWQGTIKDPGGTLNFDGQSFPDLEALFLRVAGKQEKKLDWL